MKKLFLFLMLAIGFASCDWLEPINPPEVQYTITATYDSNVVVSPSVVVVEKGDSAILDVTTKAGFTSTIKVNDKVVSLTSSKLTLSNVTSDMKIEATSRKTKQYTITIIIDSNGGFINGLTPAVTVVDSGKPFVMNIFVDAHFGYVIDKFKVNGVEKTWHPACYNFGKVNCDYKLEFTTKEMSIDPYFFGIKWRMDSIYARVPGLAGHEEYSLYNYVYYGNQVEYFFSSGYEGLKSYGKFVEATTPWSVDKTTNPNILSWCGIKYKVEVRTNKKLVLSYVQVLYNADGSVQSTDEFKYTYIPEP